MEARRRSSWQKNWRKGWRLSQPTTPPRLQLRPLNRKAGLRRARLANPRPRRKRNSSLQCFWKRARSRRRKQRPECVSPMHQPSMQFSTLVQHMDRMASDPTPAMSDRLHRHHVLCCTTDFNVCCGSSQAGFRAPLLIFTSPRVNQLFHSWWSFPLLFFWFAAIPYFSVMTVDRCWSGAAATPIYLFLLRVGGGGGGGSQNHFTSVDSHSRMSQLLLIIDIS